MDLLHRTLRKCPRYHGSRGARAGHRQPWALPAWPCAARRTTRAKKNSGCIMSAVTRRMRRPPAPRALCVAAVASGRADGSASNPCPQGGSRRWGGRSPGCGPEPPEVRRLHGPAGGEVEPGDVPRCEVQEHRSRLMAPVQGAGVDDGQLGEVPDQAAVGVLVEHDLDPGVGLELAQVPVSRRGRTRRRPDRGTPCRWRPARDRAARPPAALRTPGSSAGRRGRRWSPPGWSGGGGRGARSRPLGGAGAPRGPRGRAPHRRSASDRGCRAR
jgi:hypothetical protein